MDAPFALHGHFRFLQGVKIVTDRSFSCSREFQSSACFQSWNDFRYSDKKKISGGDKNESRSIALNIFLGWFGLQNRAPNCLFCAPLGIIQIVLSNQDVPKIRKKLLYFANLSSCTSVKDVLPPRTPVPHPHFGWLCPHPCPCPGL